MLNDSAAPKPAPGLDTGLACLVRSVRFHSVAASPEQFTHEYAQDGRLFGRPEILLAAMKLGFKTKPARSSLSLLTLTPSLAIAVDTGGRFFIIVRMDQSRALTQDSHARQPGAARPGASRVSMEGALSLIRLEESSAWGLTRLDLIYFIPAIIKSPELFCRMLLASLMQQIFVLLTLHFSKAVAGKVLVRLHLTTPYVIATALLGRMDLKIPLQGIRSYLSDDLIIHGRYVCLAKTERDK